MLRVIEKGEGVTYDWNGAASTMRVEVFTKPWTSQLSSRVSEIRVAIEHTPLLQLGIEIVVSPRQFA